jgi:hypothetical protein
MDITQDQIMAINKLLDGRAKDAEHFVSMLDEKFIIYGMDGPQRTYLAVATCAEAAVADKSNKIKLDGVTTQVASDKAMTTRVSNYFIDFNRQGEVVPKTDGGYELQRKADARATGTQRETDRADFSQRFETSKLGMGDLDDAKLRQGVGKDSQHLVGSTKALADLSGSMKNFAVRRACKFLIYDSIARGDKIVYALDDMNLTNVVKGEHINLKDAGGSVTKKKVPVCTSEIREIFRNWDYLKNHVIFFKALKKVPPPWEQPTASMAEQKLWSKYAVKRAKALKDKYGKTDNKVYSAVKSNVERTCQDFAPKPTLDAFHLSKPSLFNPKYALPVDHEAHETL